MMVGHKLVTLPGDSKDQHKITSKYDNDINSNNYIHNKNVILRTMR